MTDTRVTGPIAVVVAAVLAAPATLVAQQTSQQTGAPVRIDVAVSARSGEVPPLTAQAFTVTVNGAPRPVLAAEPLGAGDGGRTIYLAIDESSIFAGAEAAVRTAASGIADRLAPADRLGVVLLPKSRPEQAPTDDAAAIERALAGITGRRPNDFGNFSMGIGEGLAISESDTFALTGVADRDCRPNENLRPAAGSPVVPATQRSTGSRQACVQAIARNVETLLQRATTVGHETYRGLLDLVASLRETPGQKTIVIVTSGLALPLDDGMFNELAIRAALADVRVDALLVEPVDAPKARRLLPANVVNERRSLMRRLTELTNAALGSAYTLLGRSVEGLDRVMAPAAGRYRLDVQASADQASDVAARVAVTVAGSGLTARARPFFVPPAVSRTAAATPQGRIDLALSGKPPAGEPLPLDAAGYLAELPGETAALLIAGELRTTPAPDDPADAPPALTIGYLLLDGKQQPVVRGPIPPLEAPAGAVAAPGVPRRVAFAGSVDGLAPETYTLRVAATDGSGRVGVVDRPILLRGARTGAVAVGDVLVGRINADRSITLAAGVVEPGDTVLLQSDAAVARDAGATASFRVLHNGAAVLTLPGEIEALGAARLRATAVVRAGLLPPGDLEVVGEWSAKGTSAGERRRSLLVRGGGGLPGGGATSGAAALGALVGDVSSLVPRFARDSVLGSPLVERALGALEARTKADPVRRAIARARTEPSAAPDAAIAKVDPVAAAFLSGLAGLSAATPAAADPAARALARADLERTAQHFREALRGDADFLPAAVLLGACYAIGGRDGEAAGAWQTALIGIDDEPRLFTLIVDARLRAGDAAGAADTLAEAEAKWPQDQELRARRVVVDLAGGRVAPALAALDGLDSPNPDVLFAALRVLNGAHAAGVIVADAERDRERFARYAERYLAAGGADAALVKGWLAARK